MLFKWISKIIDSIYRSIQEENIQWDNRVQKLNKEILLAIERYNQMEKQFDDAKFFMQCIMYKKLLDKQKKDFKHSSIMCSISQWQNEKSTQTMKDKKMIIYDESELIDDLINGCARDDPIRTACSIADDQLTHQDPLQDLTNAQTDVN